MAALSDLFAIEAQLSELAQHQLRLALRGPLHQVDPGSLRGARRRQFCRLLAEALVAELPRLRLADALPGLLELAPCELADWGLSARLRHALAANAIGDRHALCQLSLALVELQPYVGLASQHHLVQRASTMLLEGALKLGDQAALQAINQPPPNHPSPESRARARLVTKADSGSAGVVHAPQTEPEPDAPAPIPATRSGAVRASLATASFTGPPRTIAPHPPPCQAAAVNPTGRRDSPSPPQNPSK